MARAPPRRERARLLLLFFCFEEKSEWKMCELFRVSYGRRAQSAPCGLSGAAASERGKIFLLPDKAVSLSLSETRPRRRPLSIIV